MSIVVHNINLLLSQNSSLKIEDIISTTVKRAIDALLLAPSLKSMDDLVILAETEEDKKD
jgi:hypothetical protein